MHLEYRLGEREREDFGAKPMTRENSKKKKMGKQK